MSIVAFGKMALEFAQQSVRLFAEQVMPEVRRFGESRAATMVEA
jgi:hypothetical protein